MLGSGNLDEGLLPADSVEEIAAGDVANQVAETRKELAQPQQNRPKACCLDISGVAQLVFWAGIAIPYKAPPALALIIRGVAYSAKGGDEHILQAVPRVLDDIGASVAKLIGLGVYAFTTSLFMSVFHLLNIRNACLRINQDWQNKGVGAGLKTSAAYIGLSALCLATGGLAVANNLNGLLFLGYMLKKDPSGPLTAFCLWLSYLLTALGNGSWLLNKVIALHGFVGKVKQAKKDGNCRVSCHNRLGWFLAMVVSAIAISYSFYDVYSTEGCEVILPVFKHLHENGYNLSLTNFTNVTLERVDKQLNDGEIGFNSTALTGALQLVCPLVGVFYALRYVAMVMMRIALPLVMLDWSVGCAGLGFQMASVFTLFALAVGLLGFPSAGQVVDVQDEVDFQFIFDLICFVVGQTSNNVVKVLGKPRQGIERCFRSICRKPQVNASTDGEESLSLLGLFPPRQNRSSARSRVMPVGSGRSSRENSVRQTS